MAIDKNTATIKDILNESSKVHDAELTFRRLMNLYNEHKNMGYGSETMTWAVKCSEINRGVREQIKNDPKWTYVGNALLAIWASYRRLLDLHVGKKLFKWSMIRSEQKVLDKHILDLKIAIRIYGENDE